jgi:NAD(P)-dependent dehydrogenase (short-subunit alcohol dehydrogenase family)
VATYDIAGKRILITGAARGIGAGAARALAERGARLALVGLEPQLLEQVATDCGNDSIWVKADVSDRDAISAAVENAAQQLDGIDVVIANAGIAGAGTVRTIDPAAFEKTIDINLLGVWRTVRAALPHVIKSRGYILNVASAAAILHGPLLGAYAASKAGVEAFSDSLRAEVRQLGVGVGVVYLLWIDTDMVRDTERERPEFKTFRESLRGPAGRVLPLDSAVQAMVGGIERRRDRIFAPRSLALVHRLRGFSGIFERDALKVAPDIVRVAESEVERQGAEAASLSERTRQLVN